MNDLPFFTVAVPAYNRAKFLPDLLDSILVQDFKTYEILIHEDLSPQRNEIAAIVSRYQARYPGLIRYTENSVNLGYDANLRSLIDAANGTYCFFMGNDDLMAAGALTEAYRLVKKHPDIGILIRSYSWFKTDPTKPKDTIRYFSDERFFPAGANTIGTFFRRVGVISGFVVSTARAREVSNDRFDGFLFYQMYLTASILASSNGVFTPQVLTFSRDSEVPDFGNSAAERKVFQPGGYTPKARLHMLTGMLTIAGFVEEQTGVKFFQSVQTDIGNYIYPYIRDQLNLKLPHFWSFYRSLCALGFKRLPLFHVVLWTAFILKMDRFDWVVARTRSILGRTPKLGRLYSGVPTKG